MCGDGRGKKVGWPPPLGMVGEATKRASRGVTIPDVFPSHPRVCVSRTLGPAAGMFRRSPDLPHPVRVRAHSKVMWREGFLAFCELQFFHR